MNDDLQEDDALWHLLGRARKATPSPFFVRNVLRSVRSASPDRPSVFSFLRLIQAAAFAVILAGFGLSLFDSRRDSQVPFEIVEYFDLAAGLDQLALIEELTPESFAMRPL